MRISLWAILLILWQIIDNGVSYEYRRVCYYTNWAQYRPAPAKYYPENIPLHLCTHLIYAFATMNGNKLKAFEWNDDSTSWMKGMYHRFNSLKQKNPQLQTLLGVGGWNFGTKKMTAMLKTKRNRKEFIDTSIKFLRKREFDGLDLDFEYPAARGSPDGDKWRFASLVGELHRAFEKESRETGKPKLLLSAAVAAGKDNIDKGYDIPFLAKRFDFINVMTYDFHGQWEKETGHNCPLYSHRKDVDNHKFLNLAYAAEYWHKKGAPKHKLNIGLPLYGRTFTLDDKSRTDVKAPAKTGGKPGKYTREKGYMSYYEVCDFILKGAKTFWITDCHVPYAVKEDQWVGFDDEESLRVKVDYITKSGFGGIMVWAVDLDDFSDMCGRGKYPLMTSINEALGDGYHTQVANTLGIAKEGSDNGTGIALSEEELPLQDVGDPAAAPLQSGEGCVTKPDGFYSDARQCSSYFRCTGGQPLHLTCPAGSTFHPKQKTCTFSQHNMCPAAQTAVTVQPSPTPAEVDLARAEFLSQFGPSGKSSPERSPAVRPQPNVHPQPVVTTAVKPYRLHQEQPPPRQAPQPPKRYSPSNPSYSDSTVSQSAPAQPKRYSASNPSFSDQSSSSSSSSSPHPVQHAPAPAPPSHTEQYAPRAYHPQPQPQQYAPYIPQQQYSPVAYPPMVPAQQSLYRNPLFQSWNNPNPVIPSYQQQYQHYQQPPYNQYDEYHNQVSSQYPQQYPQQYLQQYPQQYPNNNYYSNTNVKDDNVDYPTIETPNQNYDILSEESESTANSLPHNTVGEEDIVTGSEENPMTDDDRYFIDYLIYNLGALPAA